MIIDRLVLKNFKRFRSEEIRFHDGITGILGNNGTGKSSIVQAVFFALYGVQATGISADYIVSSFASPREKCEVRLDFRIGGDNYTVVRTFKKGKTVQHDATFHREEKLMATGVSQVEAEVKRVLGMGPVDFRNTIYAAQKDLLILLENTPGRRKEWFQRALGIDYLNKNSQEILRERVETRTARLHLLEGELKALLERQDEEEFAALQASVTAISHTLGTLRSVHAAWLEKKKAVDEEFRQFDAKKTEYTRLVERHASLSKETDGLVQQRDLTKSALIDLARQEQEYRALSGRVAAYPAKKEAFERFRKQKIGSDQFRAEARFAGLDIAERKKSVETAAAKVADLKKDAARQTALIAGIRKALSIGPTVPDTALETAIASCEAEVLHAIGTLAARQERLDSERKDLLIDRETIQGAGPDGVCPLCRQKLGTHYADIEKEFSARFERIRDEAVQVYAEQERAMAERDRIASVKPALSESRSLFEKLMAREALEAELGELRSQLLEKERGYASLVQKIAELAYDEAAFAQAEKEMDELENVQRRYNDLREKVAQGAVLRKQVADLETRIAENQAGLAQARSEIDRTSFDPQKGAAIEQARAEIETAIRMTEMEMVQNKERLRHAEEKIAEYRKAEKQIEELQLQTAGVLEEIDLLKLTRSLIADYVIYLMQVVRSRIEGEVSRIISEITGGRYEQVLLDEDFNLLVRDIDDDYSIDRFSGGEQDDIAVALRIALSRYLAELHRVHESTVLIFDEIFGSQDEERRNSLLVTLRTQESRFPQIILISHIPEMQGEFANTLFVEMGTDQSSRIKVVE